MRPLGATKRMIGCLVRRASSRNIGRSDSRCQAWILGISASHTPHTIAHPLTILSYPLLLLRRTTWQMGQTSPTVNLFKGELPIAPWHWYRCPIANTHRLPRLASTLIPHANAFCLPVS